MQHEKKLEKLGINIKKLKYLDKGTCAKVFYDKNIIFKDYYDFIPPEDRIQKDVFDILKDINNPHFMKLLKMYITKKRLTPIKGYTAKYYKDESVSLLYKSTDYLLDNLKELEVLFKIFTDNGILTHDVHGENTILTKNEIVLIDPDSFIIYDDLDDYLKSEKSLDTLNKMNLVFMLMDKMVTNIDDLYLLSKISYLFGFEVNEKTDITHEISKKIGSYKRPIDYFIAKKY